MGRFRGLLLVPILLLAVYGAARATPVVTVGNYDSLAVNQDGGAQNTIEIFVSGGDAVTGLDLNVQIGLGDSGVGGPSDYPAGGPSLTADIIHGTIFDGNSTGQRDVGFNGGLEVFTGTTTAAGSVAADGLLVTLVFNTMGVNPFDVFQISFDGTANGPTVMYGPGGRLPLDFVYPAGQTSGGISGGGYGLVGFDLVPEPGSLGLALIAACGLLAMAIRRGRRRR